MQTRSYISFVAALAVFMVGPRNVTAQSLLPAEASATPPASTPVGVMPAAELQTVYLRLEQQDEELRQLRERLGSIQNQVHELPPVSASAPQSGLSGGVIPAAATSNSLMFELQDRMTSLETKVTNSAADQKAKADAGPKAYEVGSDLKMSASWRNGVQIQSTNKDFRLHIGGKLQFDSNFFNNGNTPGLLTPETINGVYTGGIGPQPDSLDIRRARLRADGTMYETLDWVVEVEFANFVTPAGNLNIQSPVAENVAFTENSMTWTKLPYLGNFRVGNTKEPIGFEHLQNDSMLDLMERSYLQDFVFGPFNNGYTPGMLFFNWNDDETATWAVGVFSSQNDNFGFGLGNDYAATGRLTWLPYYDEPSEGAYLWHLGIGGSTKAPDEGFERLRSRGNIRSGPPGILNPIYVDTGNMVATYQNILSAETAAVWGSFSMVGEYVGNWVANTRPTLPFAPPPTTTFNHGTTYWQGGYAECAYFLTGEHANYDRRRAVFDRVTPYENAFCVRTCDGHCKGRGAWQVAARYSFVDLNDKGINGGELNSFTFGVNWWWNANMRVQVNYDFTHRGQVVGSAVVPPADINSLGTRFNMDF